MIRTENNTQKFSAIIFFPKQHRANFIWPFLLYILSEVIWTHPRIICICDIIVFARKLWKVFLITVIK